MGKEVDDPERGVHVWTGQLHRERAQARKGEGGEWSQGQARDPSTQGGPEHADSRHLCLERRLRERHQR